MEKSIESISELALWLQQPAKIEKVLWEGRLEPVNQVEINRIATDWERRGIKEDFDQCIRNLPVICIGEPECSPMNEQDFGGRLAEIIRKEIENFNFYHVRFVCSFRPGPRTKITWARFVVNMNVNDSPEGKPIAYALYPTYVGTEMRRTHRVKIDPTLKFIEVLVGVGCLENSREYIDHQPIISANGVRTSTLSWDYSEGHGMPVIGDKWMHTIVKVPKEISSFQASLDLGAKVSTNIFLFSALIPKKEALSHLSVNLCGKRIPVD